MAKTKPGKKDLDSYTIKGTNKVVRRMYSLSLALSIGGISIIPFWLWESMNFSSFFPPFRTHILILFPFFDVKDFENPVLMEVFILCFSSFLMLGHLFYRLGL